MKLLSLMLALFCSVFCNAQIQKINIGEFELEYEKTGTGENVILLEAGMTRDLKDWDNVITELAKTAQVIRYSRAGNGNSSATEQHFSAEQYATHTKRLLDALKINKPVIHLSHSYGGILARAFAAKYPDSVKALLLIDPASEHDLDIMRAINLSKATEEIKWLKNQGAKNGMANEYIDYWTKRPMPDYPAIGDIPVTLIATVKKWQEPPILLMTDLGRSKMAEQHKNWAESFPQGKAVFTENSYHFIQIDEPELIIREVEMLLARLPTTDFNVDKNAVHNSATAPSLLNNESR